MSIGKLIINNCDNMPVEKHVAFNSDGSIVIGTCAEDAQKFFLERTCRIIPFVEEDGSIVVGNCSECDAVVRYPYSGNYCPNCGARVVK